MNIETLKLCVQVVDYPHEEIEDLKRQIRNYEVNAKGFHGLVADMSSKLSQERLLTNETLMIAQVWKNKYEELLVKHAKVLEENVKYENKVSADADNFLDLLAQHIKLQDKHECALQELSAVKLIINTGVMTWKSEI